MSKWTKDDDDALREAYQRGRTAAAREVLSGRSDTAIQHRAHRLGLSSPRNWSAHEDRQLTWAWGSAKSLSDVSATLGRTQQACHWRAAVLGLRTRGFHGHESLQAASERAGVSPVLLEKILRRARVPIRRAYARPGMSAGMRRQRYVDSHDVDAAVAAWVRE